MTFSDCDPIQLEIMSGDTKPISQQAFRAIFENAREFIGLLSPNGTLLEVNEAALHAAGVRRDDVVGLPFWETPWWSHSPELQDRLQRSIRRAAAGEADRFDATHPAPSGELIPVDFSLTPVKDASGAVVFLVPEGRDISLQKKAEQQLKDLNHKLEQRIQWQRSEIRKSEANVERVYANRVEVEEALITVGRIIEESLNEIYIFDAESLQFILVNRGGRENTGYTIEELETMTPMDLKRDFDRESFEQVIQPLRSRELDLVQFDTVHTRKDGSKYSVEVHVQLTTFQSKTAFLAIILDITERSHAQQRIRDHEARLTAILDAAVDAIITIDERGLIETVNTAALELFQYASHELVGRNIRMLMPPPFCDEHDGYVARYLATGERKIIGIGREVLGRRKDGSTFAIYLAVSEVKLRDRRIFTGIIHDISTLKETQEKLRQADRLAAVGQMLSAIAHESRNAMQRIQAGVDVLQLEVEPDSTAAEQLRRIEKAKDDLQQLLEDLRNFAAPICLEKSRYDISSIWNQSWSNLDSFRRGKACELKQATEGVDLTCDVDAFRMEQVFRNLMQNAIEAGRGRVIIQIAARHVHHAEREYLQIEIQDDGPGMSEEHRTRIFEPFFTTKQTGTGLGMAIAQRVMEAHGGSIAVQESADQGLTFCLRLPLTSPKML